MNELGTFYDEVTKVAYDLFEKRGKVHGYDMEDWLEAEMIVQKRYLSKKEQAPTVVVSPVGAKAQKSAQAKGRK